MDCPSCGAQCAAGARFCWSCGQPLRAPTEERRVVTVLFADLVGFTALSEHLDPEQVKRLVDHAFERLVRDVTGGLSLVWLLLAAIGVVQGVVVVRMRPDLRRVT